MKLFEKYTPQQLRDAIEIELQKTDDPKTASITAIKKLEKDPLCYENMQKAFIKEFDIKKNKFIYRKVR